DVLREVPGLTLSRSGSAGRATSLFTRGSNSTHTLVLWNGIELTNPYFAGYDWGRFSTAGVEQVEVVRGPYSALYGSDAMAGVVNILTSRREGVGAGLERGGNGLMNATANATLGNDSLDGTLMYEVRRDDGFAANDDFAQQSANLRLGWNASPSIVAALLARHTTYGLGIPVNTNAAGDALVPSPERRQDGTETQLALPFEQTFRRFSYEVLLSESRRRDAFEDPQDPWGMVSSLTESTSRRARVTARAVAGPGTLVAGAEYERASVDDVTSFGPNLEDRGRSETSLFVEDRSSIAISNETQLEISAGARFDDYATFGSQLSPRLAVAIVRGGTKWRAGIGDAFRAPSVGELYFPWSGNETLEPERSRSIEAGFDRATAAGQFSATLFSSEYEDLIVYDLLTQRFANVGDATARGLELSIERSLGSALRAGGSYTLTDTEEGGTGRELLRRPRHSGSLFVSHTAGSIQTNLVVMHTGDRTDVLPVYPYARVGGEAFTTVDLNVQHTGGRFTPYLKVENAGGAEYEEVRGFPSPSRRFIVGVRFAR
ncbi:MAG: TonB-dependent receptor, partial [Thermoanaerobaculia bacterium]